MKLTNGRIRPQRVIRGYKNAFSGIAYCIKNERHMRIHLTVAAYVLVFASFYHLSRAEYLLLLLAICLVISSEAMNTAVEHAVNLQTQSYDHLARIAKDVAAGAVLICAIFAAVLGILLFLKPPVIQFIIDYLVTNWLCGSLFLLSIPAGLIFIFFFPFKGHYRK